MDNFLQIAQLYGDYIMPYEPRRAAIYDMNPINRWLAKVPATFYMVLPSPQWVSSWAYNSINIFYYNWIECALTSIQLMGSIDNQNWVNLTTTSTAGSRMFFTPGRYQYFKVVCNSGFVNNPNLVGLAGIFVFPAEPTSSYLSNITLSSGTLSPSFTYVNYHYDALVDSSVDSITVTPIAQDPNATIKVGGQEVASGSPSHPIALKYGLNEVDIEVIPQVPGVTRTYSIVVTRNGGNDLESLVPSTGSLTPNFSPTTRTYTQTVQYDTASITYIGTAQTSSANVEYDGQQVDSGATSPPLNLLVGDNHIKINVLSSAGVKLSSYTVDVTRNSSPYLTEVMIGGFAGPPQTITIVPGALNYTVNVPSGVSGVKVRPTSEDSAATITVDGNAVISGGVSPTVPTPNTDTPINIKVVGAVGGDEVDYTITVRKQ